jgi:hypothetical protein
MRTPMLSTCVFLLFALSEALANKTKNGMLLVTVPKQEAH